MSLTVALPGPTTGVGGPTSFRLRLGAALEARGHRVQFALDGTRPDVVLLIGGTRQWRRFRELRRTGTVIVQRLDGINFRHRTGRGPLRQRVTAGVRNALMFQARDHLAASVVYQSEFVMGWWHAARGVARVPEAIIMNGVDLDEFSPGEPVLPRMVVVEGNVQDDEASLAAIEAVHRGLVQSGDIEETVVFGGMTPSVRARLEASKALVCRGAASRDDVRAAVAQSRLFLSTEINAACPNSVIEAIACGTPVAGFATGALDEIIRGVAGETCAYGGDPWRLDVPDNLDELANVARRVVADGRYRVAARETAVEHHDIRRVAEAYEAVFLEAVAP